MAAALLAALVREWETNFELIAVDDGSSEAAPTCCMPFAPTGRNSAGGCCKATAAASPLPAIKADLASRAPLIAFLDADDRPRQAGLRCP